MMPVINYNCDGGREAIEKLLSCKNIVSEDVRSVVERIVSDVKAEGDAAVFRYTRQFDGFGPDIDGIRVSKEEIAEAYQAIDGDLLHVIKASIVRIRDFHMKQKQNSWFDTGENGEILGQLVRPLERVGLYVPGGKAAYPSSVLMNAVPAMVAGVKSVIMTTPCGRDGRINPVTIAAAAESGITEIYKIGGAQAVAAMAFGTESVPRVDKIVGPGNIYVASAKRTVYGYVDIDSMAGPSEILIIADAHANPGYVAADLLSQAEHDEMASSILVTNSEELAVGVASQLAEQSAQLGRRAIIESSLRDNGAVIVVNSIEQAVEIANEFAPEHLELAVSEPFGLLPDIRNAGAIFLGHYTTEPLGDYMAGPSHVLPTGGTARFFSPLTVDDFIKKTSILSFTKKAMSAIGRDVATFADAEGFGAHAAAVRIRMDEI